MNYPSSISQYCEYSQHTCCCRSFVAWMAASSSQFRILSDIFAGDCWRNRFRWASSRIATLSYVFTSLYKKNSCHSIYTHDERLFFMNSKESRDIAAIRKNKPSNRSTSTSTNNNLLSSPSSATTLTTPSGLNNKACKKKVRLSFEKKNY